jgi:hypothetical protein
MSRWRNCTVKGCLRVAHAKGLCEAHYKRVQKSGDLRPELPVRSMENKHLWTNH